MSFNRTHCHLQAHEHDEPSNFHAGAESQILGNAADDSAEKSGHLLALIDSFIQNEDEPGRDDLEAGEI